MKIIFVKRKKNKLRKFIIDPQMNFTNKTIINELNEENKNNTQKIINKSQ